MDKNQNDAIAQAEAHLRERAEYLAAWREARAVVPAIMEQIEASARQVALALEAGVLSQQAVRRIRSALTFAEAWDRTYEQQEQDGDADS